MYANFKGHYDILSPLAAKMNPDLTPCHMPIMQYNLHSATAHSAVTYTVQDNYS